MVRYRGLYAKAGSLPSTFFFSLSCFLLFSLSLSLSLCLSIIPPIKSFLHLQIHLIFFFAFFFSVLLFYPFSFLSSLYPQFSIFFFFLPCDIPRNPPNSCSAALLSFLSPSHFLSDNSHYSHSHFLSTNNLSLSTLDRCFLSFLLASTFYSSILVLVILPAPNPCLVSHSHCRILSYHSSIIASSSSSSSSLPPSKLIRFKGVRDSVHSRSGHAQDLQFYRPGPSWLGTNDSDL